jgi:hypothetical protein
MNKLFGAVVVAVGMLAFASGGASAQATPPLTGEVLEVFDGGGYTYLRLNTSDGEIWAAVARVPAKTGDRVTIIDPSVMENFESKALQRTFPTIVFGTVGAAAPDAPADSAPPASPHSPHATGHPGAGHGAMAKSEDVVVAKVAKAEGPNGRTVAEVNAERAALKDKEVVIRATVVKVNLMVMGKNWVHLRDGTGLGADGSNDLLVTGADQPTVGDVVLAKGIVRTDVDLGAGYTFKVIVEDSTFGK